MGRKGSWFSAIKRVFTSSSKDKLPNPNETDKRTSQERKRRGRLKHGESRSFIPLFREPSSIEKILEEVDQQLLFIGHPATVDQPTTSQPSSSHGAVLQVAPPKISPPRVVNRKSEISFTPETSLRHQHRSATMIQAAYRGYKARRSFRALSGLVRLKGVLRGQNVKRQTVNAMKQMQLLVRVQTGIQTRRTQMLQNPALEHHIYKNEKDVDSSLGKWSFSNPMEIGDKQWDDSLVTKEGRETRLQRKMEALMKRDRAMAYAYSLQLRKATPETSSTEIRSGGFPWRWKWLARQLPSNQTPEFTPTPPDRKTTPRPLLTVFKQTDFSSKSTVPTRAPSLMTPTQSTTSNLIRNAKSKAGVVSSPYPMKDSDSLRSCPPFSVPNYMSPTVSAKAKARASKHRLTSTAGSETSSNRRSSFPLTHNIGSSSFKCKGTTTRSYESPGSIGDLSIDSSVSMPPAFGRKPFNRYV